MIVELNEKLREHYEKFPLFGIVLFTEAHPHVVKVLKDTDYYDALNEITGEQIAVFATLLFRGEYRYPQSKPEQMSLMMPIWYEPSQNKKLLTWFNLEDSKKLPLLVFFGFDIDNNDLYYQRYAIQANSPQDTFNLLQEALSAVAAQVKTSTNLDRKDLFKKAQWEIRKLQTKQKISEFLGVASLFRGAAGI